MSENESDRLKSLSSRALVAVLLTLLVLVPKIRCIKTH